MKKNFLLLVSCIFFSASYAADSTNVTTQSFTVPAPTGYILYSSSPLKDNCRNCAPPGTASSCSGAPHPSSTTCSLTQVNPACAAGYVGCVVPTFQSIPAPQSPQCSSTAYENLYARIFRVTVGSSSYYIVMLNGYQGNSEGTSLCQYVPITYTFTVICTPVNSASPPNSVCEY